MELVCPHCQRRVTIPDDKAGQALSCPLCAMQFMAPSLAPPPPPPPPLGTYGVEPAPPLATFKPGPAPLPPSRSAVEPPPPPMPPGDYTRSCICSLNGDWLAFVASGCVIAIFVLSFFPWHYPGIDESISLWGLSFTEKGEARFLAYTILMFLACPLTIVAMLFDKGWLHAPPQLAPLMQWKNLLAGLLLGIALALLCVDYVAVHLSIHINPITLAMKLAIRLHFIAVLASFGMFWLHWRKRKNLPLPKCEARW